VTATATPPALAVAAYFPVPAAGGGTVAYGDREPSGSRPGGGSQLWRPGSRKEPLTPRVCTGLMVQTREE